MRDLLAKCGNSCGRCLLYVENLTVERCRQVAKGMATYHNWKPNPDSMRACGGCQTEEGFHYLRNCRVRLCAQHNGIETCASCTEFPCAHVPQVSVSEEYRDAVAERLGQAIPQDDYLAFIEPYEGMKHLRALHDGASHSELVTPAPVQPLSSRLVPLPPDIQVVSKDGRGMADVHRLLTAILQGQTALRADQVSLQQRRKSILTILWAMATCGTLSNGGTSLVVKGDVRTSPVDFRGIVRKKDNTLFAIVAAQLLYRFGVHFSHVALDKRHWRLKLTFDEDAGGKAALEALRQYVDRLIEAHGRPTPAGAAGYKGEAFARFSRADMRF